MPATGKGQLLAATDLDPGDFSDPGAAQVVNDWYWGGGPPPVTQIPYSWLVQPLKLRPDKPINIVDVSTASGVTVRSQSDAAVQEYGESPVTVQIATAVDADAANLGGHIVGSYAQPRMRCPQLTFDLLARTDMEIWTLLGRSYGDRIQITGTPPNWPAAATHLVIEGIQHTVGLDTRQVVWNTSPVIGSAPGVAGPWFRTDVSRTDGTDKLAF